MKKHMHITLYLYSLDLWHSYYLKLLDSGSKEITQLLCFIYIVYQFVAFVFGIRIDAFTKKYNQVIIKSYIKTWGEEGQQIA